MYPPSARQPPRRRHRRARTRSVIFDTPNAIIYAVAPILRKVKKLTFQEFTYAPTFAPTRACGDSQASAGRSCSDILADCGYSKKVRWLQNPLDSSVPYQTWCDTNGWALAMKVDGRTSTLQYASRFWTNNTLLNHAVRPYMNVSYMSDSVFQTAVVHPLEGVRIEMRVATPRANFGRSIEMFPGSYDSLTALFAQAPNNLPIYTPLTSWVNAVPAGVPHMATGARQGINLAFTCPGTFPQQTGGYRIGILWASNGCPNTGVGVGGYGRAYSASFLSSEVHVAWLPKNGTNLPWPLVPKGHNSTVTVTNIYVKRCLAGQSAGAGGCPTSQPTSQPTAPSGQPTSAPSGPTGQVCKPYLTPLSTPYLTLILISYLIHMQSVSYPKSIPDPCIISLPSPPWLRHAPRASPRGGRPCGRRRSRRCGRRSNRRRFQLQISSPASSTAKRLCWW